MGMFKVMQGFEHHPYLTVSLSLSVTVSTLAYTLKGDDSQISIGVWQEDPMARLYLGSHSTGVCVKQQHNFLPYCY